MDQDNPNGFVESERGIILNEPLPDDKPTNTTHPQKPAKKHESKIVAGILFIILAAAVAFALTQIDYTAITDSITGNSYEATDELADIIDQLELTDDGMRILKATRPELQDRDAFNNSCTNNNYEGGVVLGCHTNPGGRIYVYNVEDAKLDGIRQSILAHELLHAVWARLSDGEKTDLSTELYAEYEKNETVQKNMAIYSDNRDLSELHSVVGQVVQPDQLSGVLREHYAKYFHNHSKVVSFYEKYSKPFEQNQQKIATLKELIATKREAYIKHMDEYTAANRALTQDVDEYNSCARVLNCFKTREEFVRKHDELKARQETLRAEYEKLQVEVAELNAKISEYNAIVVRNSDLQESINSKPTNKGQEIKDN